MEKDDARERLRGVLGYERYPEWVRQAMRPMTKDEIKAYWLRIASKLQGAMERATPAPSALPFESPDPKTGRGL